MLCTASGVTARHFYEDFESREALLRALYDEIAQGVFERGDARVTGPRAGARALIMP